MIDLTEETLGGPANRQGGGQNLTEEIDRRFRSAIPVGPGQGGEGKEAVFRGRKLLTAAEPRDARRFKQMVKRRLQHGLSQKES